MHDKRDELLMTNPLSHSLTSGCVAVSHTVGIATLLAQSTGQHSLSLY